MGKSIKLISIPYDSAHFNKRMGAGPRFLIKKGLVQNLRHFKYKIFHKEILLDESFATEISSTFNLLSRTRSEVYEAHQKAHFPVILSGNCCMTTGVLAARDSSDTAVVWFDAHGDCKTPETTTSGFLDGMGIPILLNKCWQKLITSKQVSTSVQSKNVVIIGARDFSEAEKKFISTNKISYISVEDIKKSQLNSLETTWKTISETGIKQIHFHIDVDVIDPSIAVANSYSVPDGLIPDELIEIINYFKTKAPATSVTIASYDPLFDTSGKMFSIIEAVIKAILK
jgi:arginase